jgi:hypothetical protein
VSSPTIGSRVEHLEIVTTELGRQVERVALEQVHLDKMMILRFGTLDAGIAGINVRLEVMSTAVAAAMGDATSSPAGRALLADLADIRARRIDTTGQLEKFAARIGTLEQRMWVTQGAVGLTVVLLTLFGPSIRAALGLP